MTAPAPLATAPGTDSPALAGVADRRTWVVAAAVALLLWATQLVVRIPNPVSLSGAKAVNLAEIALVVLGAPLAWDLGIRGRWRRLSGLARYVLVASLVLVAVWAGMVAVRYLVLGRLVVAIAPLEYLLLGVVGFLAIERRRIPAAGICLGVLGFLAAANVWAFAMVVAGGTVRRIGLLGNINYDIGFCLMALPVLARFGLTTAARWVRWATLAVGASSVAIALLSGSRFGGVATLLMVALVVVVVDGRTWRRRLATLAVGALLAGVTFGAFALANDDQMKDVRRTFDLGSVVRGSEPDLAELQAEHDRHPQEQGPLTEADRATTPGDPDHDPRPQGLNALTHTRVLHRVLDVLHDHWLLGIGRIGPYFSGWGYQPAHNIVLEAVLYLGAVGAPAWFAVMLAGLATIRRGAQRLAWPIGFAGLGGFAMFQPLLSDSVATVLVMWLLLGAVRALPVPGRVGSVR